MVLQDAQRGRQNLSMATVQQRRYQEMVELEKWQGKLMKNRWDDSYLDRGVCFAWLHLWKAAPTHTVEGLQELYQQLSAVDRV